MHQPCRREPPAPQAMVPGIVTLVSRFASATPDLQIGAKLNSSKAHARLHCHLALATGAGIGVGVIAWRGALGRWRSGLAPVVLLGVVLVSVAGFLNLATGLIRRRNEREALEAAGFAMYGRPSIASLNADLELRIARDPRLAQRLAALPSPPRVEAGVGVITQAGLARLDDDTRAALLGIRRTLADSSLDLCAGSWTGDVTVEALSPAMRKLDEATQRRSVGIFAQAAELELAATSPPARVSGAARDAALMELSNALSPDARATFERVSNAEKPAPEEACAAFRAFSDGLPRVRPATRHLLLKIAVTPDVVDPG